MDVKIIEMLLTAGIGITTFFLKRTISEIDECKKDISECASKKEINDCKKDIAGIKEDYITKKEILNKRISAGNFVKNNGAVLRTINILKTKYNRLKNIRTTVFQTNFLTKPVLRLMRR